MIYRQNDRLQDQGWTLLEKIWVVLVLPTQILFHIQRVTDTSQKHGLAEPPSLPFLPPLGSYVGGPESGRLLQHVHGSREEEGPASPGVCQEELARHGLLWLDRVPEKNPVPLRKNLQVALH